MDIKNRIVEDWGRAHKWASVRISAFGAGLFGMIAAFPSLMADAWNAVPQSLRDRLPEHATSIMAALLFGAVIFGRVSKKKDTPNG